MNNSTRIEFFVHGHPVAQPRARATARGKHAHVYNPPTADVWKALVAVAARPYLPEKPFIGPIWLTLEFAMRRPKSHYGTGRNENRLKPAAPRYHTFKPDLSNLAKAVEDALTYVGMWHDDSQVFGGSISKGWASIPRRTGCLVIIEAIGERT